jgi:hypothetical protein
LLTILFVLCLRLELGVWDIGAFFLFNKAADCRSPANISTGIFFYRKWVTISRN